MSGSFSSYFYPFYCYVYTYAYAYAYCCCCCYHYYNCHHHYPTLTCTTQSSKLKRLGAALGSACVGAFRFKMLRAWHFALRLRISSFNL